MIREFASALFGGQVSKALAGPQALPNLGLAGSPERRLSGKAAKRYTQAYGGTDAIDWVMDCTDLIAQTASNAEYHFERGGKKLVGSGQFGKFSADGEPPPDLAKLFERPNPFMDYTEFMELNIIDMLLAGEFIWLKYKPDLQGKPLALYRLPPAYVDVILGKDGYPAAYKFTPPQGKEVSFDPSDVIHVKRPNPHDPWRGLSVIAGGPRVFDMELALTESQANYFERGTRLSGVLESDRGVPPSTWEKLKFEFAQLYSGSSNAYMVAMLERGITFKTISATAAEAQFEALTNLSKARIAKMFRVPLALLGESGDARTASVAQEAQRIFDEKTMRPLLNRIQSQISAGLTQAWDVDFVIDYEYVMPLEDRLNLAQAMATVPGVQVKDLRTLMDLAPLEEQKKQWAEIDDMILNMPGQGVQADPHGKPPGHPDAPLAGEAGNPGNTGNRVAFPPDGSVPPTAAVIKPPQAGIAAKAMNDPDDLLEQIRAAKDKLDG